MSVDKGHVPRNTTLQPLSTDLWRCSGPEISPRLYSQRKRDAQEIASHVKTHLLGRNLMATELNAQNGRPIKRKDTILPATQVKDACLGMKPPHQSLPNLVPHSEQGNPQEVLKSLLSQKRGVSQMGPRSKQYLEESGPGKLVNMKLAVGDANLVC